MSIRTTAILRKQGSHRNIMELRVDTPPYLQKEGAVVTHPATLHREKGWVPDATCFEVYFRPRDLIAPA